MAAAGAVATASSPLAGTPVGATGGPARRYSGSDLSTWTQVVGPGARSGCGQAEVGSYDIATVHHGAFSELRANTAHRGVMAHNVNVRTIVDGLAADHRHVAGFEFRLPYRPARGAWPDNAQTVEGGLFVSNERVGPVYGAAFQWRLNPWASGFGDLLCRTGGDDVGLVWTPSSHLPPDEEWHRVKFAVDVTDGVAAVSIDGSELPTVRRSGPDRIAVSDTTAATSARLQAAVINLWPGAASIGPGHRAEVRNWSWTWRRTRIG